MTLTVPATPAVCVLAKPETSSVAAAPGVIVIGDCVPLMLALLVSVAVIDPVVPAHVELRSQVGKPGYFVGTAAPYSKARTTEAEIAGQRRIHARLRAAEGHQHQDSCLRAEKTLLERVARDGQAQIRICLQFGIQAAGEVRRDSAARHLTRESDIASSRDRRVIINAGE